MASLNVIGKIVDATSIRVDLDTLLVLNIYKLCEKSNKIQLEVNQTGDLVEPTFTFTDLQYHTESTDNEVDDLVKYVKWPALLIKDQSGIPSVIAGICSVARALIKHTNDESLETLLGFRQSCLAACSESSIWTKFCEVDMVATVKKALLQETYDFIPDDLLRYEYHMRQPVRMHNVYDTARKLQRDNSIQSSCPIAELQIPHCYAEGPYMTLSDVILTPLMELLLENYSKQVFIENLPLTYNWLITMRDYYTLRPKWHQLNTTEGLKVMKINTDIKEQSLYTSDPNRYNPTNRAFTKQPNVDSALRSIEEHQLNPDYSTIPYGASVNFDWSNVPMLLRPAGGALPAKRSQRKEEQLENLVKAVLCIIDHQSFEKKTIVDFCSGSGHLGLLLAHSLPDWRVVLLENKEKSLERAAVRARALDMRNVVLVQSNLDYFVGRFDIGVALHACGVATDLVMQACIANSAHFICCPCCYGGIHDCYHITFPRSKVFQANVNRVEYLNVAHAADQTHDEGNAKTTQGYQCMNVIDTDRRLYAEACGYNVHIGKLQPMTCTPKNNLLVGIYSC